MLVNDFSCSSGNGKMYLNKPTANEKKIAEGINRW